MARKKQPKYNVGDIVVITLYGTVGKITNMKVLDGVYVYEVNNHDGFTLSKHCSMFQSKI